ncbi:MAG: hypothetical protein LBC62_06565 [Treponema sp.]|jgi:hypothetical protein|nr:hypothetical protein [Treponema sp.]
MNLLRRRRFKALFFGIAFLFCFSAAAAGAQDFGFWDEDGQGSGGGISASGVKIGGEVSAELKGFFADMNSADKFKELLPGDIFSGTLNFSVSGSAADAVISLDLTPVFDGSSSPLSIDEAYLRTYFGPVNLEAGIRKLTWGKADSFGPLDVVNPLDYSDLSSIADPQSIKIAMPMLHASWNITSFSKLEAVIVPWFQGHKFATSGNWAPSAMTSLVPSMVGGIKAGLAQNPSIPLTVLPTLYANLDTWQADFKIEEYYKPYNYTLRTAQAGTRFTTTIGSADLGIQYYLGRLPRPAFSVHLVKYLGSGTFTPEDVQISMGYNYFHQIGVDYAQVLGGFNVRAEAGINLTKDLDGTDGAVYNPAAVFSLGFDRDIFRGLNLNLQGNSSVRLFQNKLGDSLLEDMEAGKDMTSTRITAVLSKKFFRDELELKATGLWGIEDKDFFIIPGVSWSKNDLSAELSAGFFGGDRSGELGQYRDNGYIKTVLSYSF